MTDNAFIAWVLIALVAGFSLCLLFLVPAMLKQKEALAVLTNAWNAALSDNRRLRRGDLTEEEVQNLCHNLPEDCPKKFAEGCRAYNAKLFGDRSRLDRGKSFGSWKFNRIDLSDSPSQE